MTALNVLSEVKQIPAMKASEYNVIVEKSDYILMFNTRSRALVQINPDDYATVKGLLGGEVPDNLAENEAMAELRRNLSRGQFLIPDRVDEVGLLKVKNRMTRFSSKGLGLVIAPTLRCNFACDYCYVDLNANKMSAPTRERVKKFFDHRVNPDSVASVVWTGGEPSIAMDAVEDMSVHFTETCDRVGTSYDAVLITNAYKLDRKMLNSLKRSHVNFLQVSLDGDRENHNATRHLAGGKPTYDKILENIAVACEEIDIFLRVNVDALNHKKLDNLFDDVERMGFTKKVFLYFAHVDDVNENSAAYGSSCLSGEEYAKLEVELLEKATERGFRVRGRFMPNPIGEFCGANSTNYFVIDSNSQLLKCYHDLGNADTLGIGYIDDNGKEVVTSQDNMVKWMSWDPFEIEECRTCKVLPLCMGGCSHKIMNSGKVESGCLKLRYNVAEMMDVFGSRLSRGSENFDCSCRPVAMAQNV